ncbi:MAG TPA: PQQ-dependent sugar dehydrogenase [Luteolibacter sp.]|nr:PQQ-dependent sugar dehydrogenase [Luteolibacter sp.]
MRAMLMILAASGTLAFGQNKVEEIYGNYCASCHGAKFEGGVGGSLVDGQWKHGSSDAEIFKSIAKGNPQLGMSPWEGTLTNEQIRAMVVYLREQERKTAVQGMNFPKPSPDTVTKTELHDYKIETIVESGLEIPWAIAFLPDGSKLVTERPGRLRVIGKDGKLASEPVKNTPEVIHHGQGGLMEVAIHPDYEKNGWVYLGFADGTLEKAEGKKDKANVITAVVRGKIKDGVWSDQEWIYRADPKFRSGAGVHFGTRFVFDKGYIYFVVGERGGMMEAQDVTRPNGKIFRLHDDGRVPEDNPFVKTPDAIPGIWSYGHRNPQGLAMDPRDGALYNTEHGPRGGDELNLVQPGKNYGWPVITYGMNYNGTPITGITEKEGMEQPVIYWVPSIAACGLDFYTGDKFPKWKNDLFAGGLAAKEVRRLTLKDKKVVSQEIVMKDIGRVRDVAAGPDGFIYVLLNGPDRIVRLIPAN